MFCTKCGNKIFDGEKFCSKCGTPVNGETHSTKMGFDCPAKESVFEMDNDLNMVGVCPVCGKDLKLDYHTLAVKCKGCKSVLYIDPVGYPKQEDEKLTTIFKELQCEVVIGGKWLGKITAPNANGDYDGGQLFVGHDSAVFFFSGTRNGTLLPMCEITGYYACPYEIPDENIAELIGKIPVLGSIITSLPYVGGWAVRLVKNAFIHFKLSGKMLVIYTSRQIVTLGPLKEKQIEEIASHLEIRRKAYYEERGITHPEAICNVLIKDIEGSYIRKNQIKGMRSSVNEITFIDKVFDKLSNKEGDFLGLIHIPESQILRWIIFVVIIFVILLILF